jgi:hypothetical protein
MNSVTTVMPSTLDSPHTIQVLLSDSSIIIPTLKEGLLSSFPRFYEIIPFIAKIG